MHLLLDECLPKGLKFYFPDHVVFTVSEKKWYGIKNGQLLRLASAEFDVLVTLDKNIRHQQNMTQLPIAITL